MATGTQADVAVPPPRRARETRSVVQRVLQRIGGPWVLATAGAWALVRLVLTLDGARFSTEYLDYAWQLIPVETLRADPFRSVWYLHTQPPLFNLLVGGVLRWSLLPGALSLQLVMLVGSLTIVLGLQRLLVHLGLGPAVAFGLATFVSCDPELLRYEFGATYEIAVGALVVISLLLAVRFVEQPASWRFAALATALTVTALTRSLFHPLWIAAIVAVVLWATRGRWRWRPIVAGLAIPVLAIGAWAGKNEVLYGRATLSSWFGMNLQRGVTGPLPVSDLERLLGAGDVSPTAGVAPFSPYADYADLQPPCEPRHAHPSVSRPAREAGGPNFNYECYLPVYDEVGHDAWTVLRRHPGSYLDGRLWALEATLARTSFAATARDPVFLRLEDLYHLLFIDVDHRLDMADWSFPLSPAPYIPVDVSVIQGALLASNVVLLVTAAVAVARRRADSATVLVLLSSFTVLFVVMAGGLFEIGENARFRTAVNPLVVGITVGALIARVRAWRLSPGASPT